MHVSAIEQLIKSRTAELGISYAQLARLAGYANEAKGIRRLESLFDADFDSTRGLIEKLPEALGLPKVEVEAAIAKAKQDKADYEDALWRASFKPCAQILTEQDGRLRPHGLSELWGAGPTINVDFPEEIAATEYLDYVLKLLPQRLVVVARFFYPPTGFVINWSPDKATRYELDGTFVEGLSRASRWDLATVCLK